MACTEFIKLNNGIKMPALGLGTWQASYDETIYAIERALDMGYRHIDTAPVYLNEKAIGNVLSKWLSSKKVSRDDLFIVTKLPPTANRQDDVETALTTSLADLQLDYVDLYLIHTPFAAYPCLGRDFKRDENDEIIVDTNTDHVSVWKAMENMVEKGLTRSIGLSNFNRLQIERLLSNCKIRPACLQIEHHIYLQQCELVDFCKSQDISVVAYSPLGSKGFSTLNKGTDVISELPSLFDALSVKTIAETHRKTPAQVLLRWIIDRGLAAIPKSVNESRLKQNLDIFDFHLSEEEIKMLCSLDAKIRICDFKFLRGVEKHPEFPFNTDK